MKINIYMKEHILYMLKEHILKVQKSTIHHWGTAFLNRGDI